eukprot:gnl/TRDRNA2_/TRDRNA2_43289_c0_seq1.p1 gnl/TRDRNA2_/TRDRNA2_43289_c0~~gnl/TRDRNA2_/TRDRNA2_43289_c0_seq1.p1  ORF type:complete len:367 (-),score=70.89 gnl/TRDRNA2_/TRDRNA2_43289_c0_seq1:53-1153(-)
MGQLLRGLGLAVAVIKLQCSHSATGQHLAPQVLRESGDIKDRLAARGLKTWHFHRTDLDDATHGKTPSAPSGARCQADSGCHGTAVAVRAVPPLVSRGCSYLLTLKHAASSAAKRSTLAAWAACRAPAAAACRSYGLTQWLAPTSAHVMAGVDSNASSTAERVGRMLDFMRVVGKLKEVKRTGWVRSGVQEAESVADHMYRMALVGFLLGAAENVDSTKCIKMALVHDLGESLIGDLVTVGEKHRQDKITREEKLRREREAIQEICTIVGGAVGQEIRELWEEFEAGETPEALHLKDCDKLEMVLQASEYEEAQGLELPDFFRTTKGKFRTPIFKALDAEVRKRRADRAASPDAEPVKRRRESASS